MLATSVAILINMRCVSMTYTEETRQVFTRERHEYAATEMSCPLH